MSLLIGGIVSVVFGVIGFSLWWSDFITILRGGVRSSLSWAGYWPFMSVSTTCRTG